MPHLYNPVLECPNCHLDIRVPGRVEYDADGPDWKPEEPELCRAPGCEVAVRGMPPAFVRGASGEDGLRDAVGECISEYCQRPEPWCPVSGDVYPVGTLRCPDCGHQLEIRAA